MPERQVCLAVVAGVHGLAGKFKARPETDDPQDLLEAGEVWLDGRPYEIEEASFSGKGFLIKLAGVDSPDQARSLVGKEIRVPEGGLAEPAQGSYRILDLQGAEVCDESGALIGRLENIYPTGANDVYEIKPPKGASFLIPAVKDVVKKVDPKAGRIWVRLMPGLGPEGES